ncbi:MAG: hypothetical protein ACFB4I_23145 [Cyanophyceae cyanobacterium]
MQNKSEAYQAYDKYIQDAQGMNSQPCVELFQKLKPEESHIQELRQYLKEVMEKGKTENAASDTGNQRLYSWFLRLRSLLVSLPSPCLGSLSPEKSG